MRRAVKFNVVGISFFSLFFFTFFFSRYLRSNTREIIRVTRYMTILFGNVHSFSNDEERGHEEGKKKRLHSTGSSITFLPIDTRRRITLSFTLSRQLCFRNRLMIISDCRKVAKNLLKTYLALYTFRKLFLGYCRRSYVNKA